MAQKYPKILIADDDKDMVRALSLHLWDRGYEMITATDSNQVLQLVAQSKPDVIILDVNMPSGDGFDVHQQIKKMEGFSNTPVIYLTGDKSSRLDELAQRLGSVTLLHKPFQVKDLIRSIEQCLLNNAAA